MAGVRDERTLALEGRLVASQHLVESPCEVRELVVRGGHGQPLPRLIERDLLRPAPHRSHAAQRQRRRCVAEQRGERERDRSAQQKQRAQIRQRAIARVQGAADHDHEALALRLYRQGEQARARGDTRDRVALQQRRPGEAAPQLGFAQQRDPPQRGRLVEDPAVGGEDLGETFTGGDERVAARLFQSRVSLHQERAHILRARAQAGVERAVEVLLIAQVDEQAQRPQQQRHRTREHERDLQPQAGPCQEGKAQVGSSRSR